MSGAMVSDAAQKRAFSARIGRVESRQKSGRQTALMGDREISMREVRKVITTESHRPEQARPALGGPFAWILALLSGAVAVLVARWLQADWANIQLTGNQTRDALLTVGGLGVFGALVLRALFGLRWHYFLCLQVPAVAMMVIGMHNLVHLAPDAFQALYPSGWVDAVLTTTELRTILVPGDVIRF